MSYWTLKVGGKMANVILTSIIFSIFWNSNSDALLNVYPKLKSFPLAKNSNAGDPLFLTPYIENGKIKEAQNLSRVIHEQIDSIQSYSGFFTVNKEYNSNLFLWFFPAQMDPDNAPVVLWLQGGPGATSLFGLFSENGPFYITQDHLKPRKFSWHVNHNLIYIDNPVGTGYSFTGSDEGYANNDTQAGRNVLSTLVQFFKLFPNLQRNKFYITGESYAGKYIPALAYLIKNYNDETKDIKINLKGLAIGNGYTDPVNQCSYGQYLYQLGLVDMIGKLEFEELEMEAIKMIWQKNNHKAAEILESIIESDDKPSLFKNITGYDFYYNHLYTKNVYNEDWMKWVQRADVRKSIHVGNFTFHTNITPVTQHLFEDSVNSVASMVSYLLDYYETLIYSGQLDIIVAYPLTENYIQNMKWSGANAYRIAERKQWWVRKELAGYSKKAGRLIEVLVRNAGHMVPADQPLWAWDMITRFTHNKSM